MISLLDSIAQLVVAAGVGIAVIGFGVAGIMFAWPGQDLTRTAKSVVQNVILGVVIMLSSRLVIGYLASQLPGC